MLQYLRAGILAEPGLKPKKTTATDKQRAETAYHEAGHAIACAAKEIPFAAVSIQPGRSVAANSATSGGITLTGKYAQCDPADQIIMALAGEAAEAVYCGRPMREPTLNDLLLFRGAVKQVDSAKRKSDAQYKADATAFVVDHWPAIVKTAEALLSQPALTRDAVHDLYLLAYLEPTGSRRSGSGAIGVDRENKVIHGYVVAEAGDFHTPGRGNFDDRSLAAIVELINRQPIGVRSRFTHPHGEELGLALGRSRNAWLDGNLVRADLHLNPAAFISPLGNLGEYVLTLVETDPAMISSSLVLNADKTERRVNHGLRAPHWMPTEVFASDLVAVGDAVHGPLLERSEIDDLENYLLQEYVR